MWRGAHGRLAAIVVLAGGVSSCMPPPTRPPGTRVIEYERRRGPYDFHCGSSEAHAEAYLEEERRSPEKWRQTLAAWIQGSAIGCANQAESRRRYGELRVTVKPERNVAAQVHREGQLTEADRVCVEAAAGRVVEELTGRRTWRAAALDEPLTVYVSLGAWPPLFPPSARFTTDWLAAGRSLASRSRFEAQLPAEVALEDGGCLSIPRRASFDLGLKEWLAAAKPFDWLWQASSPLHEGVLGGERPGWDEMRRAYWIGDQAVLVHRKAADEGYLQIAMDKHERLTFDSTRQQICLLPLDGELRREIRTQIDQRGSCWAGDLGEILVQPRTEFPTGQRFKTVAVGRTRACATDGVGAITCCGERLPAEPPPEVYSQVAVGQDFDCGLTAEGDMRCWGRQVPGGGGVIAGPFEQIAIDGQRACAIRRDRRSLACWSAKGEHAPAVMPDRARAFAFMSDGPCAALEKGGLFCFGASAHVGRGIGAWRTLATDQKTACGVGASSGREVRCLRVRDDAPPWTAVRGPDRSLLPTGDEPIDVALARDEGCVLGRSGHLACWSGSGAKAWDGRYGAVAAGAGRFCAITAAGDVRCDRGWPR